MIDFEFVNMNWLGRPTFGCYQPVAVTGVAQFHNLFGPLSKVTPSLYVQLEMCVGYLHRCTSSLHVIMFKQRAPINMSCIGA